MSDLSHLMVDQRDGVAVVRFAQATVLDASQIDAVSKELFALIEQDDYRKIAVDMRSVQMISSQTLGVFLKMHKQLEALEGRMVLCGIDPKLYRVFKITNLTSIFQFYDDTDLAVQSFGETS